MDKPFSFKSTPPPSPRVTQPPPRTGATTSRQHDRVTVASPPTSTEEKLTASLTVTLNTHQQACCALEDVLHKPVGRLQMDAKTCEITLKLFSGPGALMRSARSMERGISRLWFEVPTHQVDKGEVLLVVELLSKIAVPNVIAELLAAAAMSTGQTMEARLKLLVICQVTVEDHELMLCGNTVDQLVGALQAAWIDGQHATVNQIARMLGKSLVRREAAKALTGFLVKVFDQAMHGGQREIAEQAIDLLSELPWPAARKAIEQPLLVMGSMNAEVPHAVIIARCRTIASVVRDDQLDTAAQLHLFGKDLAARLCISLETMMNHLRDRRQYTHVFDLELWADKNLSFVAGEFFPDDVSRLSAALTKITAKRPMNAPTNQVDELLQPFLAECHAVCAYASIAPNPAALLPIFQLIRHLTFGFSIETVTLCVDFFENPAAKDIDRAEIYKLMERQLPYFVSTPDRAAIVESHFSANKLFFHRFARAAFLLDTMDNAQGRIDRLFDVLPTRKKFDIYRDELLDQWKGFHSSRPLNDIATHIIDVVVTQSKDDYSRAPFYQEIIGEYLRHVLKAGMRGTAEAMLDGLTRKLKRGFANLILGASGGGKLKDLHALLDLCAASSISKSDLGLVARFVSDVLLEVAQSNDLKSLLATVELIQEKWPRHLLEIMAVCYVQAKARNQLLLVNLVRLEMSRFSGDIARGRDIDTAMIMALESLNFESHHASPRRPSLQANRPEEGSVARLMGELGKVFQSI